MVPFHDRNRLGKLPASEFDGSIDIAAASVDLTFLRLRR